MFEERIAAMNQRTEEAMAANAVQFDKRTYTVDEIQDILGISRTSAYNLVKASAKSGNGSTPEVAGKNIIVTARADPFT